MTNYLEIFYQESHSHMENPTQRSQVITFQALQVVKLLKETFQVIVFKKSVTACSCHTVIFQILVVIDE